MKKMKILNLEVNQIEEMTIAKGFVYAAIDKKIVECENIPLETRIFINIKNTSVKEEFKICNPWLSKDYVYIEMKINQIKNIIKELDKKIKMTMDLE